MVSKKQLMERIYELEDMVRTASMRADCAATVTDKLHKRLDKLEKAVMDLEQKIGKENGKDD